MAEQTATGDPLVPAFLMDWETILSDILMDPLLDMAPIQTKIRDLQQEVDMIEAQVDVSRRKLDRIARSEVKSSTLDNPENHRSLKIVVEDAVHEVSVAEIESDMRYSVANFLHQYIKVADDGSSTHSQFAIQYREVVAAVEAVRNGHEETERELDKVISEFMAFRKWMTTNTIFNIRNHRQHQLSERKDINRLSAFGEFKKEIERRANWHSKNMDTSVTRDNPDPGELDQPLLARDGIWTLPTSFEELLSTELASEDATKVKEDPPSTTSTEENAIPELELPQTAAPSNDLGTKDIASTNSPIENFILNITHNVHLKRPDQPAKTRATNSLMAYINAFREMLILGLGSQEHRRYVFFNVRNEAELVHTQITETIQPEFAFVHNILTSKKGDVNVITKSIEHSFIVDESFVLYCTDLAHQSSLPKVDFVMAPIPDVSPSKRNRQQAFDLWFSRISKTRDGGACLTIFDAYRDDWMAPRLSQLLEAQGSKVPQWLEEARERCAASGEVPLSALSISKPPPNAPTPSLSPKTPKTPKTPKWLVEAMEKHTEVPLNAVPSSGPPPINYPSLCKPSPQQIQPDPSAELDDIAKVTRFQELCRRYAMQGIMEPKEILRHYGRF